MIHRLLLGLLIVVALPNLCMADEPLSIDHEFIGQLSATPNEWLLRDLAKAGSAGEHVGPLVIKLLDHEDWRIRLAAARTLGFIGHAGAVEPLIKRLDDPTDVRINWIAAQSLGRLQALAALPALRRVADSHWYPPVQMEAAAAIEHIELRKDDESRPSVSFPFEFFAFQHIGTPHLDCRKPAIGKSLVPRDQKLYASKSPEALEQLTISVIETSSDELQEIVPDSDTPSKRQPKNEDPNVREEEVQYLPTVALRVAKGWIVGSNRGEWGGELAFRSDDGATQLLKYKNVEDIYFLGEQVIVLTGLAHLSSNNGVVYVVEQQSSGEWSARPWRGLPGAPMSSWLTESGEVLINTANGGTVLLHPSGTFRVAPCLDP
ncbi:MAG: HEAT repeat domain-containing protein [Ahniella sp.]|nr:HEAT repeat domain-containing protein [Ahniella sp.]